jgi:PilZ domain
MLNKLKAAFSLAPSVEYVDFEDGLLAVRTSKVLKPTTTSVKLRISTGTVLATVLVESYDPHNKLYRLKLLDREIVADSLDIERREAARLPKVVRVTSQHFPGFRGTTEDISVTGSRVTTTGLLEVVPDIQLTIELDDSEIKPISLYADVAWSAAKFDGSFQSGLRFVSMNQNDSLVIKRYIVNRLALEKKLHTLEDVDPADFA